VTLGRARTRRKATGRRLAVRITYDLDLDFLWALRFGEVIDGQLEDETDMPAEGFFLYRRGRRGRVIGFGLEDLYAFELPEPEHPLVPWLRFDAPTLGVSGGSAEQVILAARPVLDGYSTPDVVFFDLAVAEGNDDEPEEAEPYWRECLAAGDMKAHFGLGYTLCDLGRYREAYGHLLAYTQVVPRNAWAWSWLGRASEEIGEPRQAAHCYRRAIRLERDGSYETDAGERLDDLRRREPRARRRR
jgi:tetratricopeptide (TPR) repeat protein